MAKRYNVKVDKPSDYTPETTDAEGFLVCSFTGGRMAYTRGEAQSKSRLFGGKIVAVVPPAPEIHHPENVKRAGWAANALVVFTKETYGGDEPGTMHEGDLETAVQDLITDLLHYYNQARKQEQAQTPEELHGRALRMYEEELAEPDF